jgi:hypothetical protein
MLKDIAKKYRVSEPSVRKKCKEYGIDHTRKCITKLIDEEDVRRMYVDEKMSIQEIAAHYDTVYCGTLLYHMKKWGMTKDKSDLSKKQIKRWGDNDKNDFVPSLFLRSVKRRAKRKNIPYDLTADFILNMYIRQNGKCAISGMDISLPKNNDEYAKHLHTVSVDRIDSNKGYTKNNVQLLHKDINRMKWSHSEEYFLSLCENIYQNQTK